MSNIVYTQGTGSASTDVFVTQLAEINPSLTDINFPVGKRWVNVVTGGEFILAGQISSNGQIYANWIALGGTGGFTPPLTVPNGGTGETSFTPYSVLCSGTTNVGPLTVVNSTGTLGQVLTSQGSSAYPIWSSGASVVFGHSTTIITESTTFTPGASVTWVEVFCVAGGGGGGGASTNSVGGGGGGGGYTSAIFSKNELGTSPINVNIGAGGTGGSAGQPGSGGSNTTFGTFMTTTGGQGGLTYTGEGNYVNAAGGTPGNGAGGDINLNGQSGLAGFSIGDGTLNGLGISGSGGASFLGFGAPSAIINGNNALAGINASNYGAGGSGGVSAQTAAAVAGGNGGNGVVIIKSYEL
jgi:hypothetical protein